MAGSEFAPQAQDVPLDQADGSGRTYVLRLYVTGTTPNSQRAIENVRRICAEHLAGRYELEVIDLYQNPVMARDGQLIAAPTLVKELPPPLRRFIGSMSETDKLMVGLDIKPKRQP